MKKWNQINKRLKTIIKDGLKVSFNHSPLVKKTEWSEYAVGFFQVKFKNQVIWSYPKDNSYYNFRFCDKFQPYDDWYNPNRCGQKNRNPYYSDSQYASPENIIAGYLDTPKDKLLEFEEPTGIRYILWACDKRIGVKRLSEMQFIKQALPIVKERVPEYNLEPCLGNGMTLIYSDETISIFGKSKWCFKSTWCNSNIHRFIVADNPSYSLAKQAIEIDFNGQISKWYPKIFSKNLLKITPVTEEKIISALKLPSKNIENKTNWEVLLFLENKYPITEKLIDENMPLFEKITKRKGNYD